MTYFVKVNPKKENIMKHSKVLTGIFFILLLASSVDANNVSFPTKNNNTISKKEAIDIRDNILINREDVITKNADLTIVENEIDTENGVKNTHRIKGDCGYPDDLEINCFKNGEIADAEMVNKNFFELLDLISEAESSYNTLWTKINKIRSSANSNASFISNNSQDIIKNTELITNNVKRIEEVEKRKNETADNKIDDIYNKFDEINNKFRKVNKRFQFYENRLPGVKRNSLGMTFVLIPAGEFNMGSPSTEDYRREDETNHKVTLTKNFYMQNTEVTQGQWNQIMGWNPSANKNKDFSNIAPVENISWHDVQEFIEKMNQKKEGIYRLPTEAEWEYAARAGTETKYFFGKKIHKRNQDIVSKVMSINLDTRRANYMTTNLKEGIIMQTFPVASFQPNSWGLYDMHGNVYEWCQDWYERYPYTHVKDPKGPDSGTEKVYRGGSFHTNHTGNRSAFRDKLEPGEKSTYIGFRLCLSIEEYQPEQEKNEEISQIHFGEFYEVNATFD